MNELNSRAEKISFYKTVFALVFPMAIQNLINVGVQAADVLMLGRVGEVAISASSLAGQIYFVLTLVFFGLNSGAAILTAQYWGKGDKNTIENILGLAMRVAIVAAVAFTVVALLFPTYLMRIFSHEPDVIASGAEYLQIVALAYIPAAFTAIYLGVVRSTERVIISTVVYLVSLIVNVIGNAILIFGLFGAPALGVKGAAIATAIARYVELIIVLFYAFKMNKTIRLRLPALFKTDKLLTKDFIKYSVPVTFNEIMWGGGISAINAIIGHMGKAATSANSVVQVVRQLAMVIVFGLANATAIILGKTIGEGKLTHAKTYSVRLITLTGILGVLGGLLILSISPVIKTFMALGEEADGYLSIMMYVMSYFVVFQGFTTVLIVGVFRAGGDTNFGLVMDIGTLWCIVIPLGAIAAFWLRLPVEIVYIILTADELLKIGFVFWRFRSYKWLNNLTRDFN
ncbi:MAG: MATE family efflux transporter [Clostridia bacterium]|nr:MATE family efflux transporter [Clostridia bacterium]